MNLNEAGILAALIERPHHGYSMIRRLNEMGVPTPPATGGTYRRLTQLEARGLVGSEWELPDKGPAKRTFHITDKGRDYFMNRVSPELRKTRNTIEGILRARPY